MASNITPGQQKSIDALKRAIRRVSISFWAAPDRIDVATQGTIFGMDVSSLLAMQATGPLNMMNDGWPIRLSR